MRLAKEGTIAPQSRHSIRPSPADSIISLLSCGRRSLQHSLAMDSIDRAFVAFHGINSPNIVRARQAQSNSISACSLVGVIYRSIPVHPVSSSL